MASKLLRSEDCNVQWALRQKKKETRRDEIKRKKVAGEPHLNHVGRPRSGILTGRDCRCKRLQCFSKFSLEQKQQILQTFYGYTTKNDQDACLAGLISHKSIQQRRPRGDQDENVEEGRYVHEVSYYYKIRLDHMEQQVCKLAFISLHGITAGRLRTIQRKILLNGTLPKDGRGQHNVRPHKCPLPVLHLIRNHIRSFKARQSHYSLRDNPKTMYLPETLTRTEMHSMFLHEIRINVPYIVYYNVFHNEFNIKFGLPRTDTCCICDELKLKIECEKNPERKNLLNVQKTLHLSKADRFRELKKEYRLKAKTGECTVISFDYMQNLPMPHIRTGDVFYSRQMWYYVFGVHDLSDDSSSMYVYTETTAKKGANDVTSLLLHYLNNKNRLTDHLVLLSDGCSGQNKNHVMVYFQYMLVHVLKMFKKVTHIFPIRGHSYLPNDEDFALIAKKKNKCSAEVPRDWDKIILEARKHPKPFKVVPISQDRFYDIKKALTPYFLKTPRPALQLRKLRVIEISETHQLIKVRENFSGPSTRCVVRNKKHLPDGLNLQPLYSGQIPMSAGKVSNLVNLSRFLTSIENQDFFRQFTADPNLPDVDVDDEDNSDGCE